MINYIRLLVGQGVLDKAHSYHLVMWTSSAQYPAAGYTAIRQYHSNSYMLDSCNRLCPVMLIAAIEHVTPGAAAKYSVISHADVHHGNGTQDAFEEDDRVLFISIHQDSNYPIGSGQ